MHAHTRGNECAQVSLTLSSSRDHHRLILFFSNRLSIGSGVAVVVVLVVSRNVVLVPFGIAVRSNSIVPTMNNENQLLLLYIAYQDAHPV